MNKYILLQIKLYKDAVLRCLMHKYHLNENDARKVIRQSYLLDSLAEFPEETMHEDVENTADDIYFDCQMRRELRGNGYV